MRTLSLPQAPQRTGAGPLLRVLAGFVAALLLATTSGQVAHFLLVRHVVCAEHGELLEAPSRAARSHAVKAEKSGTAAREREPALEHDHCQVLAHQQSQTGLLNPAPVALSSPPAQARIEAHPPRRFAPALLPPLSRAPKTSPPAARPS